jgi:ABC-2 type transport system ATP-binding protein
MTLLFELSHVTHDYGQTRALHDVSLAIAPGAIGLVGQNGAGKSTLMQILLGLISPSQGTARVLGQPVQSGGIELRGRIGYMPEREAMIPGLNGIEYAALAGELCGLPRKQALRRAHEMLSYLELEEARYRKMEQFSVGMKQRLKLAATLVHDPDVLLLDEPTAGLDPAGRAAMLALLCSLAARPNKSLILSSHLLGDIQRVCTAAIVLDQGRVIAEGRLEDLRTVNRRCYHLRFSGPGEPFLAELRESGADVQAGARAGEARVVVGEDWNTRAFFERARRHGTVLTGLEPEAEEFDAVYHRLIEAGARPS